MVQDTKDGQRRGEDLESLLAHTLFESTNPKEVIIDPSVDASKYESVNMQYMIAAKLFTKMFKDEDLLNAFNNKNDPNRMLKALVAADIFLEGNELPAIKESILKAAREGNAKEVINLVSFANYGTIDEAKLDLLLESKVATLLSKSIEVHKLDGVFAYEKLEGKLGKGFRVTSKDFYFEHRNLGSNYKLRIKKEGAGYKALVHVENIDPKDHYNSFISFYDACKEATGLGEWKDKMGPDLKKTLAKKLGRSSPNYFRLTFKDDAVLTLNLTDNHYHNSENKGRLVCSKKLEEGLIVPFIFLGLGTAIAPVALSPYLLFASMPIGAAIITYAGMNINYMDNDKLLIHQKAMIDRNVKKYKKELLISEKPLEDFVDAYNRYCNKQGTNNENEHRMKAQEKLNEIKSSFEDIKYNKGFVAEFKSESLDDIYLKSYAIIEQLKQIH